MNMKIVELIAAFAFVLSLTAAASAQYAPAGDVIIVRLGYSTYDVESRSIKDTDNGAVIVTDPETIENRAINIQGEYNINMNGFLLGLGVEYAYTKATMAGSGTNPDDEFVLHFISPTLSAKYITAQGLYFGAGLSGRYLMSQSYDGTAVEFEFKKKMDIWGNVVAGAFIPIAEYYYIDIQGRLSYNLTNRQFAEILYRDNSSTMDYESDIKRPSEVAIYVGIVFRASVLGL